MSLEHIGLALLLLICLAKHYGIRSIEGPLSDLQQSLILLNDSLELFQYATVEYEIKEGPDPQSSLIIPTTIQDKRWKHLYNLADDKLLAQRLTTLVARQMSDAEAELIFLRKVVATMSRAFKNFELQKRSIPGERDKFIHILKVTRPLYNFNLATKSDIMRVDYPEGLQGKSSYGVYIETTGIKWASKKLQKRLKKSAVVAPQMLHDLEQLNPESSDLYIVISALAHEMAHIARWDQLAEKFAQKIEGGSSERNYMIQANEMQADAIALLVLQHETYFLHQIHYHANNFLVDSDEGHMSYVARKLLASPTATNAINLFNEAYNRMSRKSQSWVFGPQEGKSLTRLAQDVIKSESYEHHPASCIRVQSALTAWAAYLVHVQGVEQKQAVEQVHKKCTQHFEKSFGTLDSLTRKLLFGMLDDWAETNKAGKGN